MDEQINYDTIETKPNSTNTLKRLYNENEEFVQKLKFFTIGKSSSKGLSIYMKKSPSDVMKTESKGLTLLKGSN